MTRPCPLTLFLLFLTSLASTVDEVAPIVFPKDGGILDVGDFGAIPDDDKNNTKAIQAALDLHQ